MTLSTYMSKPESATLKAVCYYGRNGRYYYVPVERVASTSAGSREIDQFITDCDDKEIAWLR